MDTSREGVGACGARAATWSHRYRCRHRCDDGCRSSACPLRCRQRRRSARGVTCCRRKAFSCRMMQSRQWTSLICWAVVGSRFLGLASTHPFVSLAYFSLVFIFSLVVISLVVSCLPESTQKKRRRAPVQRARASLVARVCGDARVQRACQACSARACSCARRRAARSARRHGDRGKVRSFGRPGRTRTRSRRRSKPPNRETSI